MTLKDLIAAYVADPTSLAKARAVARYNHAWPLAACSLNRAEYGWLIQAQVHAAPWLAGCGQ